MELSNLQNVMFGYLCQNKLFNKIIPFSSTATIIYGIYSVLYNLPFIYSIPLLYKIRNFVWVFVGIIYIICILGLIISFAKNDMMPIMILFALLSVSDILKTISSLMNEYMGIGYAIQDLIYVGIYAYFAYMAMVRYNKTGGKVQ